MYVLTWLIDRLELSRFSDFSGDLQHSAPILSNFLEMLQAHQDDGESVELVLSDLTVCPGIGFSMVDGSGLSDLLKVYDQVGEFWMTSLPVKVSNLARLSKFKVARKVAIELCLSSIAVSHRRRAPQEAEMPLPGGEADLPLYNEGPNDSGLLMSSPQITTNLSPEVGFGLPTPSRSPSVYSHVSNNSSEATEHPSISRLRQYAISIKSQPDLGESALLAKWPSSPGVDPTQYSWHPTAAGDGDENDSKRREEERRRRRTEKFLNRERIKSSQASPQPTLMRSGSQPELGQPATSSQTVDVPMTQPDRGAFGARSVKSGKKKQARRRAAGF
jgi:RNA polymerase I-specific transcription initiation factor RRN6